MSIAKGQSRPSTKEDVMLKAPSMTKLLKASVAAIALVVGLAASVYAQEHPLQQPSGARDAFVKSAIAGCESSAKAATQDSTWQQLSEQARDFAVSKFIAACPCTAEKAANEITSDELLYEMKNKRPSDEFNALMETEFLICSK